MPGKSHLFNTKDHFECDMFICVHLKPIQFSLTFCETCSLMLVVLYYMVQIDGYQPIKPGHCNNRCYTSFCNKSSWRENMEKAAASVGPMFLYAYTDRVHWFEFFSHISQVPAITKLFTWYYVQHTLCTQPLLCKIKQFKFLFSSSKFSNFTAMY